VGEMIGSKIEVNQDRRAFIRKVLSGAIGGSLLLVLPVGLGKIAQPVSGAEEKKKPTIAGRNFVFVVDLTSCIGCGVCCVADKAEYQVPDGFYRTWVERYVIDEADGVHVDSPRGGLDGFSVERSDIPQPARDTFFVPKFCNMCERPSCVQVCPVAATFQTPNGFVLNDAKRCIGCGYCVQACPYSVRFINPVKKVVEKCSWCYHRVSQGMPPACVSVCPVQARKFGNLDDKESEVYKLLRAPDVISVLKPEMGNDPALYYLGLRREVT
jgi:tetrathionate reductase subunit B